MGGALTGLLLLKSPLGRSVYCVNGHTGSERVNAAVERKRDEEKEPWWGGPESPASTRHP